MSDRKNNRPRTIDSYEEDERLPIPLLARLFGFVPRTLYRYTRLPNSNPSHLQVERTGRSLRGTIRWMREWQARRSRVAIPTAHGRSAGTLA